KVHMEPAGPDEKGLAGRHDLSAVEDDGGDDGFPGGNGQAEGAVMKGFQWIGSFIAGAFRVDAHMQTHVEHFFHFYKAFFAAGLAASVHQHATGAVEKTE